NLSHTAMTSHWINSLFLSAFEAAPLRSKTPLFQTTSKDSFYDDIEKNKNGKTFIKQVSLIYKLLIII
ncbi:MAG: hypothetical protein ACU83V_02810, partial [Gammaproteobacteria bacterium]